MTLINRMLAALVEEAEDIEVEIDNNIKISKNRLINNRKLMKVNNNNNLVEEEVEAEAAKIDNNQE